jgi:hypothetical protein
MIKLNIRKANTDAASNHAHLALQNAYSIWYTASVTAYHLTLRLRKLVTYHSTPPPVGGYQTAVDLATPMNRSLPCTAAAT